MRKAIASSVLLALAAVSVAVAGQSMTYALSGQTTATSRYSASADYALAYAVGQSVVGSGTSVNYAACYGVGCRFVSARIARAYLPLIGRNETRLGDAFEPDDTLLQAKAITPGDPSQTRNFYPAGDVDWVRLAIGPGTYVIATSVSNNLYPDTMVALYATDGVTQIAFNDDCTGFTRASCLTYTLSVSATLYLKVWPYDDTSIGVDSWYGLAVGRQ